MGVQRRLDRSAPWRDSQSPVRTRSDMSTSECKGDLARRFGYQLRSPARFGTSPHNRMITATNEASGPENYTFRLLVQSDPATRTGFMIAVAVRYMSVHSWKQPDSHGHSGTSQPRKQQPARPGIPSSRAVFRR